MAIKGDCLAADQRFLGQHNLIRMPFFVLTGDILPPLRVRGREAVGVGAAG